MDRKDLGVGVLLGQAAGVQQSLVGPVCELSAVHDERGDREIVSVEIEEGFKDTMWKR